MSKSLDMSDGTDPLFSLFSPGALTESDHWKGVADNTDTGDLLQDCG